MIARGVNDGQAAFSSKSYQSGLDGKSYKVDLLIFCAAILIK